MPVLYPIVFVGLLAQNILDRLLLCFFYREPPHYDEQSVLLTLKILRIVGVGSLLHNFWILTNRQIFEGFSSQIQLANDVRQSEHSLIQSV